MCADKHEELLEVWTQDGRPTGEIKTRKVIHEQGLWHKIVHVWCVDPATRRVLLQRRSADKCTNPDKWDISCAGHIEAGETSLQGALKELHEELGITAQPEKLQFLFTAPASGVYMNGTYFDNELQDIYLYETDVSVSSLVLQPEEVTDAKWVGWDEFEAQLDSGDESLVAVEKGEYGPLFALLRERYPLVPA
ncbi:hydrolase, NUDIX domain containing protein [Acanthamoeba castellanii str. Neff]|uniref:Hydrolase, NUDIX domain containing protein n=1 Tax=Acanthamoeba castellanii (strain ATCC 30010 / Neff) TaxID=1257118 RepID=L8H877_ACACF|nr:hydrolase, NUDIX domain containing protein [Acanthamoeba castellanii str. Neff]ELR20651.1 hydrolase, NUDIX domain containing protein [Acanthamoeba castellanii str. Neff]